MKKNKTEWLIEMLRDALEAHGTPLWSREVAEQLMEEFKKGKERSRETPIALYNFFPRFCPSCGTRMLWKINNILQLLLIKDDYLKGASVKCDWCGLVHQYTKTKLLTDTATKSGGDLKKFLL